MRPWVLVAALLLLTLPARRGGHAAPDQQAQDHHADPAGSDAAEHSASEPAARGEPAAARSSRRPPFARRQPPASARRRRTRLAGIRHHREPAVHAPAHVDGCRGRGQRRTRSVGHRRAGAPAACAHSARHGRCRPAGDVARERARPPGRSACSRCSRPTEAFLVVRLVREPSGRPHGRPTAPASSREAPSGASRSGVTRVPRRGGRGRLPSLSSRGVTFVCPVAPCSLSSASRCLRRQPPARPTRLPHRSPRRRIPRRSRPLRPRRRPPRRRRARRLRPYAHLHAHLYAAGAERADRGAARGPARSREQGEGAGQGPRARGAAPPASPPAARGRAGARRGSAASRARGSASHRRRRHARHLRHGFDRRRAGRRAAARIGLALGASGGSGAALPIPLRSRSRRPRPSSPSARPSPRDAPRLRHRRRSPSSSSCSRGSDMRTRLLATVAVLAAALLAPSAALAAPSTATDRRSLRRRSRQPSPSTSHGTICDRAAVSRSGDRRSVAAPCTTGLTNIWQLAGGAVLPGRPMTFSDTSPLAGRATAISSRIRWESQRARLEPRPGHLRPRTSRSAR